MKNGWSKESLFLDLFNIGPADDWKSELRRNLELCSVLVFLCSEKSLESFECRLELRTALDLKKSVLILVVDDTPFDDVRLGSAAAYQFVKLSKKSVDETVLTAEDSALIVDGLINSNASPDHFRWVPEASPKHGCPFPGLRSFSEAEAGIYFGRDTEINDAMSLIRLSAKHKDPTAVIIQAASGVGKSSFLRAGIWPRLKREPLFLPLGIARVSKANDGAELCALALQDLLSVLSQTLSRRQISEAFNSDTNAIIDLFHRALRANDAREHGNDSEGGRVTLVLGLDQADEVSSPEQRAKFEYAVNRFRSIFITLRKTFDINLLFLMTARTAHVDTIAEPLVQQAGIRVQPYQLPAMTKDDYRDVILGPCKIANDVGFRIIIESSFCDAVIADCDGPDSLPLLAYGLRRVFEANRRNEELRLTAVEYEASGGISRLVQNSLNEIRRELKGEVFEPLLKKLIVPNFVEWSFSSGGEYRTTLVSKNHIYRSDTRNLNALCDLMISKRLIIEDQQHLEIAHETLIRQPPVSLWIAEEEEFLRWIATIKQRHAGFERGDADRLTIKEIRIAERYVYQRVDEISSDVIQFVFESMEHIEVSSFQKVNNHLDLLSVIPTRKTRAIFSVCALILILLYEVSGAGARFASSAQNWAFDIWQEYKSSNKLSGQVAVVYIERSNAVPIGRWPFLRSDLADVIDTVRKMNPKHIVIDFNIYENGWYSPVSLKRVFGDVVFDLRRITTFIDPEYRLTTSIKGDTTLLQRFVSESEAKLFDLEDDWNGVDRRTFCGTPTPAEELEAYENCVVSPSANLSGKAAFGSSSFLKDRDGVVRRLPLFEMLHLSNGDARFYPHIAFSPISACSVSGKGEKTCPELKIEHIKREPFIRSGTAMVEVKQPEGKQTHYRLSDDLVIWVDYSKLSSDAKAKRLTFSAFDLLDGRLPESALKDKIVLIGGSGPQMSRMFRAPNGDTHSSAIISALALDSSVSGKLITSFYYDPLAKILVVGTFLIFLYFWFFASSLLQLIAFSATASVMPIILWVVIAEGGGMVSSVVGLSLVFLAFGAFAIVFSLSSQLQSTRRLQNEISQSSFGELE